MTSDNITREYFYVYDDAGNIVDEGYNRVMSPADIVEREQLNFNNTASAQRARVVEELSKSNGSNHDGSIGKPRA